VFRNLLEEGKSKKWGERDRRKQRKDFRGEKKNVAFAVVVSEGKSFRRVKEELRKKPQGGKKAGVGWKFKLHQRGEKGGREKPNLLIERVRKEEKIFGGMANKKKFGKEKEVKAVAGS